MKQFGPEVYQSGGTFSSMPSVPKNEIILFEKDTSVLGYTLLTDIDDEVIYVTKGSGAGGAAGGSDRGTWTLTTSNHTHGMASHTHSVTGQALSVSQMPSHRHQLTPCGGQITQDEMYGGYYGTGPKSSVYDYAWYTTYEGGGATHDHGGVTGAATGSTATGGSENITLWRPLGRCFTRQQRL